MTCCAHSTLWFIPSLSDNVHFPGRREFDLVVNLGLQGRWYFSPVSVVSREEEHRHAGTGFAYSVILLDWWIWTLKTHIHTVICHQLLRSGFGSVGLWRKRMWPRLKTRQQWTHTSIQACRHTQISVIMIDCSTGAHQPWLYTLANLAKGWDKRY